jgi:hypothetical protein
MNVNVMVNDYSCTGVCLFIRAYVLFCMHVTQIDARSGLWARRAKHVEDNPPETFEQGKWILPLHILFVPN